LRGLPVIALHQFRAQPRKQSAVFFAASLLWYVSRILTGSFVSLHDLTNLVQPDSVVKFRFRLSENGLSLWYISKKNTFGGDVEHGEDEATEPHIS
jgi:hypothetical protein